MNHDYLQNYITNRRGKIEELCRRLTIEEVDTAIGIGFFHWDRRGVQIERQREGGIIVYQISWVKTMNWNDPEWGRVAIAPLPAGGVELLSDWYDAGQLHIRTMYAIYGAIWRRYGRQPSGQRKPGQKPRGRAEKVEAWHEWQNLTSNLTFEEWSELKWGTHPNGDLRVPKSTFYSWPRK